MADIFNFPGSNYTKDAFVSALRFGFENVVGFEDYKYSATEAASNVQIYKEFPRRIFKPPTIVVRAGASENKMTSLGTSEFLEETLNATGGTERVYGKFMVPIVITIHTLTTTDREKLTDLTVFFLRHLFRQKFHELGIAYTSIATSGEGQVEWDNQIIYTNSVSVDVYQEYFNDTDFGIGELIKSFQITCDTIDPSAL